VPFIWLFAAVSLVCKSTPDDKLSASSVLIDDLSEAACPPFRDRD
jgi:hypothetical protein